MITDLIKEDFYYKLFNKTHMYNAIQNTPENQVALNTAIVNAIAETQDIVADSTNPFHKNKYASLSAHLAVLKPIFKKHGLAVLQFPYGDSESVGVKTFIIHKDGGMINSEIVIPVSEIRKKDKNTGEEYSIKEMTGQQAGALISYLRRYALASVAGVATEDDDAEIDRTVRSAPYATKSVAVDVTVPKKNTKYIPNPNAEKAVQGKGSTDVVAPFGDAKGTPLSALPLKSDDRSKKCADLNYWANAWQPKPFGDSGVISKRDLATKAEAQRLWAEANSSSDTPSASDVSEVQDEIPF